MTNREIVKVKMAKKQNNMAHFLLVESVEYHRRHFTFLVAP